MLARGQRNGNGKEYDEWYFQDMKDTIEIIDWALAQDFDYFEYESSW